MHQINFGRRLWAPVVLFFLLSSSAFAQVDSTAKKDSMAAAKPDTTVVTTTANPPAPVPPPPPAKKSLFILYGGVTFNNLSVSSNKYESSSQTGWQAGFNYRSGNFIYWQIGARYNSSKYGLRDSVENTFSINDIGIPLTAGISLFSATQKAVNLRVFLSVIPSWVLSVSDNPRFNKDDTKSFFWSGQAGVGADFLFLVLEAGYNYGFSDVLEGVKSQPRQGFVTLGVRF